MARKVRRVRRRRSQTSRPDLDEPPPLSPEEAFRQEYRYVLQDLRRVFIVAAFMFLLLIALNLVI